MNPDNNELLEDISGKKLTKLITDNINASGILDVSDPFWDSNGLFDNKLLFDNVKSIYCKRKISHIYRLEPEFYHRFPNLVAITLVNTNMTKDIVIKDLPNLQSININNSNCGGAKYYSVLLSNLPKLTKLTIDHGLDNCDLHNSPIKKLHLFDYRNSPVIIQFQYVNDLYISGRFTQIPNFIQYMTELRHLNIATPDSYHQPCYITDTSNLRHLKKLQILTLSSIHTNADCLQYICNMKSLEGLCIKNSIFVNKRFQNDGINNNNAVKFPDDIGNLVKLRDIQIINTNLQLPTSFNNLIGLERCELDMRDLAQHKDDYLPLNLSHLILKSSTFFKIPRVINRSLRKLHIIGNLHANIVIPKSLTYTNLVELHIISSLQCNIFDVTFQPIKFKCLESLSITNSSIKGFNNVQCSTLIDVKFNDCSMCKFPTNILQSKNMRYLELQLRDVDNIPIDIDTLKLEKLYIKMPLLKSIPITLANIKDVEMKTSDKAIGYGITITRVANIHINDKSNEDDFAICVEFWRILYLSTKYKLLHFNPVVPKGTDIEQHTFGIMKTIGRYEDEFMHAFVLMTMEIIKNGKYRIPTGDILPKLIVIILKECCGSRDLQRSFISQHIQLDEAWFQKIKDWLISNEFASNKTRSYLKANKLQPLLEMLFNSSMD